MPEHDHEATVTTLERPRRRSPWSDPRALLGSATFHVVVVSLAVALAAVSAAIPGSGPALPRILHAELGPVDNRAPAEKGGGALGEAGGDGERPTAAIRAESRPSEREATGEAAADSIVDEMLAPTRPVEPAPGAQPGATTSGLGLLVAPGSGGGGGSGGGAGGGTGRGIGPATEFFGARERAESFAYVIDCSASMGNDAALDLAKREMLSSIEQLPPDAKFGVIFYNLDPTVLSGASGGDLMPATAANKDRIRTRLAQIRPDGGTRPRPALEAALSLKPEVVFLLTDGQELSRDDVPKILDSAGDIRIHTIEFGSGPAPSDPTSPLRQLAAVAGGTYRHVDVRAFRRDAGRAEGE